MQAKYAATYFCVRAVGIRPNISPTRMRFNVSKIDVTKQKVKNIINIASLRLGNLMKTITMPEREEGRKFNEHC